MKGIIKTLIPVMLLTLAACGNESSSAAEDGPLEVYTTVFPLKSFTEQIGGDTVNVQTIYPKGVDIHTYEPTQKDMVGFAEGDLFVYTTDEFDPVANTIKNAVDSHTEFLPAAASISDDQLLEHDHDHGHEEHEEHGHEAHEEHGHEAHEEHGHEEHEENGHEEHEEHGHEAHEEHGHEAHEEHGHEEHEEHGHEEHEEHGHEAHEEHGHEEHEEHGHDHGSTDPHVWLDPVFAQSMAEEIKDKLVDLNPEQASLYEENYESLITDLDEIDEDLKTVTEDTTRDIVYISHESIGYLADRYGFEQAAINGLNNEEPSQQDLTAIVDDIEENDVDYILYEQNVTSRVTDTIQSSTGTETLEFHNLEVLTDEDADDATYQSLMRDNISVLDRVLNE
ncbi:metal ABC transporter solute-binding protein, Zn/Mn family [Lacicoccus alkaliphilus]|uniref:Zinc transport system substrate-binding protein n=2 Tax=Lacicoccus TaxID=3076172 RepID=A0A1M7J7S5_9BACL|nr:zinc ABC transporter substrate-binding protein [Salinicoccus alkaliphilus]SHM48988.1 zinc transport system substrate-binding protein [Salinicoccus alkaliphilus DSM 16010]